MSTSAFGTILLCVALLASGVAAASGIARWDTRRGLAISAAASGAVLVSVFAAFLHLMKAYAETDLSLFNVFMNSHSLKPFAYKLTGTWANHEGSLLLWLMILAGFGGAMAFTGKGQPELRKLALGIQGSLAFAFLLFTILTSSPFEPYPADWPEPPDGQGLNPLLQDPGLAIHPPMLYLGYVGLSAVYSFTIAALFRGELGRDWAQAVRPFLLFAWGALTLGIGLGAWWAYYELGWGGFWFWDPVENASLMPWLAATALLHCVMVVERRDALKPWCAALAVLAFGMSLLGAFLVRSGIVTSVHAFANDPSRGMVLLIMTIAFTGGGLLLFALRGDALVKRETFEPVSREGALVLNNLLFSVLLFTVFLGTFWPTILEVMSGTRITVGPPYYNVMAAPLALIMAAALAFGLLIPWKRSGRGAWIPPYRVIVAAALVGALALTLLFRGSVWAIVGFAASLLVLGGIIGDLWRKAGSFSTAAQRLSSLPARSWGAVVSHFGLSLLMLGITGASVFQTEIRAVLSPGETTQIRGYELTYAGSGVKAGKNYLSYLDGIEVRQGGELIAQVEPSRRYYPVADKGTTEIAIKRIGLGNLYIATGAADENADKRTVRAYIHPLIHVMWFGVILIALGGFIAAFSPRLASKRSPAASGAEAPEAAL
ncbi:MAG: heme lyase CcmF/NrfE family subunit [Parvularculaceae bacterium]|nr:heme lyase CcmF/NrfE family subunit [Parvularculaceae bacterium]